MSGVSAVAAPFLAATVLLGGAGAAKLWKPEYTARALDAAGLPAHRRLVRFGAMLEVVVAVAAVAWPSVITATLVALAYGGFAAFVLVALHQGWALSSCGCFGRPDSRPTYRHAVLNALAAVAAIWWAAGVPSPVRRLFDGAEPWHGAPLALITLVIAGLAYLIWNDPVPGATR